MCKALEQGLPLRGGVAFGEAFMEPTAGKILGKPLVDAHLTETGQDWVGVGIHPSCFAHPDLADFVRRHEDVVPYSVPLKSGAPKIEYALLWHQQMTDAEERLARLRDVAPG